MFPTFDPLPPHSSILPPDFFVVNLLLLGGVLARLKGWWGGARLPAAPIPYEIPCACGEVAAGFRKPEPQAVRCARCGEELFVLPLSRLPEVAPPDGQAAPASPPAARRLRPWAVPALAAALTAALLVAAYVAFLIPPPGDRPDEPAAKAGPEEFAARLAAARREMGRGNFRLALEDLRAARPL